MNMAVRRSAGVRNARRGTRSRRGDGLSTTPTQYGETSPDYRPTAGDPDFLKSFSEEQIGMLGGREKIASRVSAREERDSGFSDPSDTTSNQDTTLTTDTPAATPGPTTPPTTYGSRPMPKPGAKLTGTANAMTRGKGKKRGLYKRIAKTTGTTTGEAQGLMRGVRKQVRTGNKKAARRTITKALSGGPRAGVKRTPQRVAKARTASTKITARIATRQKQAAPKRRKK